MLGTELWNGRVLSKYMMTTGGTGSSMNSDRMAGQVAQVDGWLTPVLYATSSEYIGTSSRMIPRALDHLIREPRNPLAESH